MADNYLRSSGAAPMNYLSDEEAMRRDWPLAADRVYGPDKRSLDLDQLMRSWHATAPEYAVAPESGRVPQFAGPQQMAPPLDRESSNVVPGTWADFAIGAATYPITRRRDAVLHLLKSYLGPSVTMEDISRQLPQEPIPYLGAKP